MFLKNTADGNTKGLMGNWRLLELQPLLTLITAYVSYPFTDAKTKYIKKYLKLTHKIII
jgi:hypothetical protein